MAYSRVLVGWLAVVVSATTTTASGPATPMAGAVASSRAGYRELVDRVSLEHGLDPKLVDAVVKVESGYNPRAVSRKGAVGLMQLMPATASRLGVSDPFDPEQNVRGGVREFARLVDVYRGNLQLALAAYNAGEGAVSEYRGIPPYAETRDYVAKILALYTGRPYRLADSYRVARVRLVTDPSSGRTVITNQPDGQPTAGISLRRAGAMAGPLTGGFGASGN